MSTNNDATREMKIVSDWLKKEDPLAIATHMVVDADAAFSAALLHTLRPSAAVVFVRADAEITEEDVIAVDLMNGPRAVKGLNSGSAFGFLVSQIKESHPEFYSELKPWADQLNLTDQAKRCDDRVVLANLIEVWRASGLSDRDIVDRAVELLQGKQRFALRRHQQQSNASEIEIKNGVAVVKPEHHVRAKDIFRQGAHAVVRESHHGLCIVLSRKPRKRDEPEFHEGGTRQGLVCPSGGIPRKLWRPESPKDPKKAGVSLDHLHSNAKDGSGGDEMMPKNLNVGTTSFGKRNGEQMAKTMTSNEPLPCITRTASWAVMPVNAQQSQG